MTHKEPSEDMDRLESISGAGIVLAIIFGLLILWGGMVVCGFLLWW